MSDWDRNLVNLITEIDGPFAEWELRELVEEYGAAPVARLITDGIAAVTHATFDEAIFAPTELEYVPREEAIRLCQMEPIPAGYRVVHRHETLEAQSAGLLFRYAADDPAAIAEVRLRAGLA